MAKKNHRQVRVDLSEWMDDLEDLVDDVIMTLSDLPGTFMPPIIDTLIWFILHDQRLHEEDYWSDAIEYSTQAFSNFFNEQNVIESVEPLHIDLSLIPNNLDLLEGSTREELMYVDFEGEVIDSIVGVSDAIPDHYKWADEEDMDATAEIIAEQLVEMFAEYDLSSSPLYCDVTVQIRDEVYGLVNSPRDIKNFDISVGRKRLMVLLNTDRRRYNKPFTAFIEVSGLEALLGDNNETTSRNGSGRSRAYQ